MTRIMALLTLLLVGIASAQDGAALLPFFAQARVLTIWEQIQSWSGGTLTNAAYTRGPSMAAEGDAAFYGGVLLPSGKVVLVPRNADYVGIYDPVANTYTRGPYMAEGNSAFVGGVLLSSGKVVLVPYYADYVGIYDPDADTYTRGPSIAAEGDAAFVGGVLLPSGKVVLVPYSADYVGLVTPSPLSATTQSIAESAYLNKF